MCWQIIPKLSNYVRPFLELKKFTIKEAATFLTSLRSMIVLNVVVLVFFHGYHWLLKIIALIVYYWQIAIVILNWVFTLFGAVKNLLFQQITVISYVLCVISIPICTVSLTITLRILPVETIDLIKSRNSTEDVRVPSVVSLIVQANDAWSVQGRLVVNVASIHINIVV